MSCSISSLETALLTALEALKTAGTVTAVLNVSADPAKAQELIQGAGARCPFLALALAGGTFKEVNKAAGLTEFAPDYTLLIAVSSARKADAVAAGLDDIVEAASAALLGQKLSLDIEPISLGRLDLINWTGPVLIYGLDFSTRFVMDVSGE